MIRTLINYKNCPLSRMFSILALVLFISTIGYAQNSSNQNNTEKLIGTWVLDYNKTISKVKTEAKQYYDSLKTERKQSLQTSFSQRKMTFEADGSYTLVVNAERQVKGTWSLKQDDVTLEIKTDGRTITHSIGKISNQNLELHLEKSKEAKQLLGTWHLDKVSN